MASKKKSRAAQGSGTIRKKTVTRNGKQYTYWEGRLTIGIDGSGKQKQRSFTGKTQKEVREALQRAAVELNEGTYMEPSKLTVAQWAETWMSEYMGDKKYMTVRQYRMTVDNHIVPELGAIKLSDLTAPQIQKFYNNLLRSGRKAPRRDANGKLVKKDGKAIYEQVPMSAKSVRNVHGILTKCLSTAVRVGLLRQNPADMVTLPRVEKQELHPLTDEQVKFFMKEVQEDRLSTILLTIIFTGMRESEAIGLTWDCIDFKKNTVTIAKQLQKRPVADGGTVFAPLKNNKTRSVTVAPFVMQILERQWTAQAEQRLLCGELWQGWQTEKERKTALAFTSEQGTPITPSTLRRHFKLIVEKIGVPSCRVHDLRHTFAVLSLQNGDDIKTVQGNLGHATAAFTLDVYGHVSEKMKEDSAARMQAYISAIGAS